jgi:hypothetical protein
MRQLTDYQIEEALDRVNRFFTWLALGKPPRPVTEEECIRHYAENASLFHAFTVNEPVNEADFDKEIIACEEFADV